MLSPLVVCVSLDFNPRPPWGGRLGLGHFISQLTKFQSTPSVGRATVVKSACFAFFNISIHALRGEGDDFGGKRHTLTVISIHALRGEGDR